MISMIKNSPPMLLHKPETFEEMSDRAGMEPVLERIPDTGKIPPLHFRRPAIMTSYCGKVCVTGYAGSKESFKKTHEQRY